MATAMLVQSRRQRASLEAEYAEAEALLLEAKENMETSQRGQMQLALELRARAEAAEAEVARLHEEIERLQVVTPPSPPPVLSGHAASLTPH